MKRTNTVSDALNTGNAMIDPGDGLPIIPIPLDGQFPGRPGPAGPGVPEGGTAGQYIEKTSTGTTQWATPSKSKVGLSNVDNTSDKAKPISDATQVALDAKATMIEVEFALQDKADKATVNAQLAGKAVKLDLVSELKGPLYLSHRGGPKRFPEHSMEGYRASFQDGFIPEPDLQMLGDGTVVCIHNDTTSGTLTGPNVNVSTLNKESFRARRIKPALPGGKLAVPATWDQVLDEFGGRTVLVPEVKGSTPGLAEAAISAVTRRGLEKSIIMWSADYATVKKIIAAGIYAGYLVGTGSTADRLIWAADGVYGVALATSVSDAHFDNVNNAGMKVFTYTPATKAEAEAQFARGAFAAYVDDCWGISGKFTEQPRQSFSDGYVWPGSQGLSKASDSFEVLANGTSVIRIPHPDDSTTRYVEQGWAGAIPSRSVAIDLDLTRANGVSTTSAARVYLSRSMGVAANESQADWLMFHVRRSGEAVIYRRVAGQAAAAIATLPGFLASLASGASDTVRLRFAIDSSGAVSLSRLDTGAALAADATTASLGTDSFWMSFGMKGMAPAYGNVVVTV